MPVKQDELGVDMITIVGHKISRRRASAALYIREGTISVTRCYFLRRRTRAGRRAGTENVLHIVGLGKACEIVEREMDTCPKHLKAMRDELQTRLGWSAAGRDEARRARQRSER